MSLEKKVMKELKVAMKARDKDTLRSLRAIKSAILLSKTDGSGTELSEESEIKLLQKLIKQRKDSLAIYDKQGREDLAIKERSEIEIISKFLPEQMDLQSLRDFVATVIEEVGATSMRDMGKVMGKVSKALAGKADGKTISGIVKELLNS